MPNIVSRFLKNGWLISPLMNSSSTEKEQLRHNSSVKRAIGLRRMDELNRFIGQAPFFDPARKRARCPRPREMSGYIRDYFFDETTGKLVQLAILILQSSKIPMLKTSAVDLIKQKEKLLQSRFEEIDFIAERNLSRVLTAFKDNKVCQEHFNSTSGYGLDDVGRETLEKVYAQVFSSEAALVRVNMVCGTHAIACAILGNTKAGERFICLTGTPYDSLEPVLGGKKPSPGSLVDSGAFYIELDLNPKDDDPKIEQAIRDAGDASIYYLQKSCGYSSVRPTYSNEELGKLIRLARKVTPKAKVIVDNCYGEFVELTEPTECGADLVVGSLIKNPGGGLAICGGYLAGTQSMIDNAARRLTAPGVAGHMGPNFNQGRHLFQGLFMAPSTVAQAMKGVLLITSVFEELGMNVKPKASEPRFDIIQAIEFGDKEKLINFARAMQRFSPVDAHVEPEPFQMPGYEDPVVMAGGTFVEGATIELSCDGPIRPPYIAYLQGGLTYHHVKCYLEGALSLSMSGELPFA